MNKSSAQSRNILILHQGTKGVRPLCDALRKSRFTHGEDFSATTETAVLREWVFTMSRRQLLVIGPCDTRSFMHLAGELKGQNPELLIALVGPKGKDSDVVDEFIRLDAVGPEPFRSMIEFIDKFARQSPKSEPAMADSVE